MFAFCSDPITTRNPGTYYTGPHVQESGPCDRNVTSDDNRDFKLFLGVCLYYILGIFLLSRRCTPTETHSLHGYLGYIDDYRMRPHSLHRHPTDVGLSGVGLTASVTVAAGANETIYLTAMLLRILPAHEAGCDVWSFSPISMGSHELP